MFSIKYTDPIREKVKKIGDERLFKRYPSARNSEVDLFGQSITISSNFLVNKELERC